MRSKTALHAKSRCRCRYRALAGAICLLIVAGATYTYVVPSFFYWTFLSPEGSLAIVRNPPAAKYRFTKLPSYDPSSQSGFQVDLRGGDISDVDLRGRLADLMHANFDSRTVWPADLPDGFDPKQIMNFGRNPGLSDRVLHQRGIVGNK